ncbi:MAG: hypothetical protein KAI16_02990 [Candidatus Pacebacteria bacterium]|nr:hypothetical protein [Candidatus Paceibacterota bacterium]
MKTKHKTIQNIAGEILLYFYVLKTKKYQELQKQTFDFFTNDHDKGIILKNKENKKNELVDKYSDTDLYNALKYLQNKNFVFFANGGNYMGGEAFHVIELTDLGIDIIENVEKVGGDKKFIQIFNLNLNVESLLKIENDFTIESIIKASIL